MWPIPIFNHLQPFSTIFNHLQPSSTIFLQPSSTIFNTFWIIVEWAKAGGAGLGHVYHLTSLEAARRTGELGLMILMAKGNRPKWLCVQCRSNMIPQYTSCLTRSATWTVHKAPFWFGNNAARESVQPMGGTDELSSPCFHYVRICTLQDS